MAEVMVFAVGQFDSQQEEEELVGWLVRSFVAFVRVIGRLVRWCWEWEACMSDISSGPCATRMDELQLACCSLGLSIDCLNRWLVQVRS
jgi:hypothetical protein